MLYPGTIFGIAAHVSGETAKAVSTAVLGNGRWSRILVRSRICTGRSSADHMLIFGTIR